MKRASRTIRLMGTVIDIMIEHENPEPILEETVQRLHIYEHRFSANDERSELSAVNQQAGIRPVQVHSELFELICIGKEHSCASDSFLNIAIGPLIQLWRIGFKDAQIPSEQSIRDALTYIDPHQIELDREKMTVFLAQSGMKIDLGALAKGYIADCLIDFFKEENVHAALLNLGGNLVTMGPASHQVDNYWRIGIQHPFKQRGEYLATVCLRDGSVVTSGIYERILKKDGRTFHHIFDQRTGYPVETDVASISIISSLSVDGEIWTTRLFGLSTVEILHKVAEVAHIECIIVNRDGEVFYSPGVKERLNK